MNSPHDFTALQARGKACETHVTAAVDLLATIAREFAPVALANSLGVEDMVLTDMIARAGLDIEIFSLDTGRLHVETYTLMETLEQHYGLRLKLYHPQREAVDAYVSAHGADAFYQSLDLRQTCCGIRKVEPLGRALAGKRAWITGLRAQQTPSRSGLPRRLWDEAHGLEKFNPLADWSEQQVWDYVRSHQVPYNALHDRHFPSIGCAPCTRAIAAGEDIRAGRWWWENGDVKECGLHRIPGAISAEANIDAIDVKAQSAGRSQNGDIKECGLHRIPGAISAKANIDAIDVKAQSAGRSQTGDVKECGLHVAQALQRKSA